MRRTILPATALLALTSCAATPDPGYNTVSGGATGAAAGAAIGCVVTIPVGCAPGAALGAIVGGASGGTLGLASTPPPPVATYPAGPPVASYPYSEPSPYWAASTYSAPPPPSYSALPPEYPGVTP